jgi:hypothetical protein
VLQYVIVSDTIPLKPGACDKIKVSFIFFNCLDPIPLKPVACEIIKVSFPSLIKKKTLHV